jgi:hypothetical protein
LDDVSQGRYGAPAGTLVKIATGVTPGHPLPLHTPLWGSDLADGELQVLEVALNVNTLAVDIGSCTVLKSRQTPEDSLDKTPRLPLTLLKHVTSRPLGAIVAARVMKS